MSLDVARCRSMPLDAARCRSIPLDLARCRSMSLDPDDPAGAALANRPNHASFPGYRP
jgi:hypothetical protein